MMSNAIEILDSDESSQSTCADSDNDFLPKAATSKFARRRRIVIDDPSSDEESMTSYNDETSSESSALSGSDGESGSSVTEINHGNSSNEMVKQFEKMELNPRKSVHTDDIVKGRDGWKDHNKDSKINDEGGSFDNMLNSFGRSRITDTTPTSNDDKASSRYFTPNCESEPTGSRNASRTSFNSKSDTKTNLLPKASGDEECTDHFVDLTSPRSTPETGGKYEAAASVSADKVEEPSCDNAFDDCAWVLDSFNDSMYLSTPGFGDQGVKWPDISVPCDLYNRLYPHQKAGVQWMASMHCNGIGGILGDDMGMGKTFQTLTYLGGLMKAGEIRNALIVGPVSVLQSWGKEARDIIQQHCVPDVVITVVDSDLRKDRRRSKFLDALECSPTYPHLVITTYGIVTSTPLDLVVEEYEAAQWDYVVLDEGHKIKNPTAKVSKSCKRICRCEQTRRILLTGTPIQNNLKELWALFDWATSGKLLGKLPTFERQFARPIEDGRNKNATEWTMRTAEKCSAELQRLLQPHFLQRMKKTTFADKLPTKRELVIWTHLSPKQRSLYERYLKGDKVASVLAGTVSSPLESITWLKKLCGHPLLVEPKCEDVETKPPSILIDESAKLEVLVALIERLRKSGHKTLVFSQSTRMLDIIQQVLRRSIFISRIDGSTKQRDRQKRVDNFNRKDSRIDVMLLSTRAAGLGLTLTGADRCVVYDPSWNPAEDSQAVDRCYRISQTKDVTVYRLIAAGTVEEKMYEKQVHKDGIRRAVMTNQGIATERFFDKKDLRRLFELAPAGECMMLSKFNNELSIRGSSGKPTFLQAHDGVVGVSSHDAVYNRSVINLDDDPGAQTPFNGTPARNHKVLGRSQRALLTKGVLNFSDEKENTGSIDSAKVKTSWNELPNKAATFTSAKEGPSITNIGSQYYDMHRLLCRLEEGQVEGKEKLDCLKSIAILGRELGWLYE